MIKVDLITGFLGSGKTTFIREYVKCFDYKIGIIENDFGAINVDRLLLQDIESDNLEIEQVVGGNIVEDYRRRFRTKLISMAMRGFKRIIVEPSGIFNPMEFFDVLSDDTISNWYEPGNVFTIIDANELDFGTKEEKYIFTTEVANSSKLIIRNNNDRLDTITNKINSIIKMFNCSRTFDVTDCVNLSDVKALVNSGYVEADYEKIFFDYNQVFSSVFIFNKYIEESEITKYISNFFENNKYGIVKRVKGYFKTDRDTFIEVNAIKNCISLNEVKTAQEVIIVIGESLNQEAIINS